MWKNIATQIKEAFFPKRCFFCNKYGSLLCGDCQTLIEISHSHNQNRAGKYLSDIYSACSYENRYGRKLIRQFKYEPFCKELGAPLANLINSHFKLAEVNLDLKDAIIVPIHLAKKRLRWRGFNQAEVIAKELGMLWNIPITNCLLRTRETATQTELDKTRRQQNINGAFACPECKPIKNKTILLVDDVITTGATMEECARVLSRCGAKKIIGITVARAAK